MLAASHQLARGKIYIVNRVRCYVVRVYLFLLCSQTCEAEHSADSRSYSGQASLRCNIGIL